MVNATNRSKVDLVASAARVASAREVAAFQARIVESATVRADDLNIDLFYLTQENVLVIENTHRLLMAISARESACAEIARVSEEQSSTAAAPFTPATKKRSALGAFVGLVMLALFSACLLELLDLAPMSVQALQKHARW